MTLNEFFGNDSVEYLPIVLMLVVFSVISWITFYKRKGDNDTTPQNSRQQLLDDRDEAPIQETASNEYDIQKRSKWNAANVEVAPSVPLSVNYHFTRQCNYQCGFCFHTAKTSAVLPMEEAKRGLRMLKDAGLDKSTVSRAVRDVCDKLCGFKDEAIKWPSVAECQSGKRTCFAIDGFPSTIGAVDGTHIRIQAPTDDEPSYINRKGFHSINVQGVCDADGMEKVNFSGGEPFIVQRGTYVGELVTFCKRDLALPSVTIVSNGSLITEKWFKEYGECLDILAISCDSFHPQVNKMIGRYQGKKNHLESLQTVRDLCYTYKVAFKINTVVNTCNKDDDMAENILALAPCRWKVFQCLLIGGENAGKDALKQAETFVVTETEFETFLNRHKSVTCLVPESNEKMRNSYLILDEYMRFLDCTRGGKDPSKSILDVGVSQALMFSGFDESMFFKRGGRYIWSKADMELEW